MERNSYLYTFIFAHLMRDWSDVGPINGPRLLIKIISDTDIIVNKMYCVCR